MFRFLFNLNCDKTAKPFVENTDENKRLSYGYHTKNARSDLQAKPAYYARLEHSCNNFYDKPSQTAQKSKPTLSLSELLGIKIQRSTTTNT